MRERSACLSSVPLAAVLAVVALGCAGDPRPSPALPPHVVELPARAEPEARVGPIAPPSAGAAPLAPEGHHAGDGATAPTPAPTPPTSLVREGPTRMSARLPVEVVRQVVGRNLARIRRCYDLALAANPTLSGRVIVKLVIGPDGLVARTADGGSDLPDPDVIACVLQVFGTVRFPAPDGGPVNVVYPLVFQPAGASP